MKTIAVIFAGGKGTRLAHKDGPKQFVEIGGKPIIAWTLDIFQKSSVIDSIYVVSLASHIGVMQKIVSDYGITKVEKIVPGGYYAMDSIFAGLNAAVEDNNPDDAIVLLHDGVRPIINTALIDIVVSSVQERGNAITSSPAFETLASSKDGGETLDSITERSEMYTLQAPQAFRLGAIYDAHIKAKAADVHNKVVDQAHLVGRLDKTDLDVSLAQLHLIPGVRGNIKITTFDDINYFEFLIDSGKYEEILKGSF